MFGGKHFLLEYDNVDVHEETTYRVSAVYQKQLLVWYHFVLVLQEGAQSQP